MNWPWSRKPATENETAPAVELTPVEVMDVAEVARQAVEMATPAIVGEVTRAITESRAASPAAQPAALYALDSPITFSTPQSPRRPPGKRVSVDTLRVIADSYDVVRSCIRHLQREVAVVPLRVVAKIEGDDSPETLRQIAEAEAFLETMGGLGGPGKRRGHFERELFEDVLVVGAGAVYFEPGPRGSVIAIDATTIRPNVDAYGFAPGTEPYEQWVQGMKVRGFLPYELYYDGIEPVTHSPFFKSPLEWLLAPINAALRADDWNLSWLTDGTSGGGDRYTLPADWTPEQIQKWLLIWEAQLQGKSKNRQKTMWMPGGSELINAESRKDADFQAFEMWLCRRTCGMYGVSPAAVGYSGDQYKESQEGSLDQTTRFGAGELLDWRTALYNEIWARKKLDRIKAINVTASEEKGKERADKNAVLISSGQKTINEARAEEGKPTVPGGDVILVPVTLQPLSAALAPKDAAPDATAAPTADDAQTDSTQDDGATPKRGARKVATQVDSLKKAIAEIAVDASDEEFDGLLERIQSDISSRAQSIMTAFVKGDHTREQAREAFLSMLEEGHGSAAYLGRRKAGDDGEFAENDKAIGQRIGLEQIDFADGFLDAAESGAYIGEDGELLADALNARCDFYPHRARGTANEGWSNSLPDDDPIDWVLDPAEDHCSVCPSLAEDGPYTPNTLPCYPGENATPCLFHCGCSLQTKSGRTGF